MCVYIKKEPDTFRQRFTTLVIIVNGAFNGCVQGRVSRGAGHMLRLLLSLEVCQLLQFGLLISTESYIPRAFISPSSHPGPSSFPLN